MIARMIRQVQEKVFLIVAGANLSAERHCEDTIRENRAARRVLTTAVAAFT